MRRGWSGPPRPSSGCRPRPRARSSIRRRSRPRRRDAPAPPTGFRAAVPREPGVLHLVDQRKLPDVLEEFEARNAAQVGYAIREMIIRGAPAIGQAAALGLALTANARSVHPPVRAAGDAARRGQRPAQLATDRGQPALGGRPGDGAHTRRSATCRRMATRSRRRSAPRPTPSSSRRPRTTGGWPGSAPRSCETRGRRSAADPDPLQHRAARVRPVRHRARRRPGGPSRRPRAPRLGRRDTALPAGLAADRLGAGAGRRAAHPRSPTWPRATSWRPARSTR